MAAPDRPERACVVEELYAVRASLERSADELLGLIEQALSVGPGGDVSPVLHQMLGCCGFGDLAGQRLASIAARLAGTHDTRPDAALMNGPSANGLRQAQSDALFAVLDHLATSPPAGPTVAR